MSGAGDVNGDRLGDILIGAYGDSNGGTYSGGAYLVLGGVSGRVDLSAADVRFIGEDEYDFAGRSVSGGGDANGDGLDDILIDSYSDDEGGSFSGSAYLILSMDL